MANTTLCTMLTYLVLQIEHAQPMSDLNHGDELMKVLIAVLTGVLTPFLKDLANLAITRMRKRYKITQSKPQSPPDTKLQDEKR